MSDYHDYNENLAFPPQGDWSDTQPKNNTDRTQSSCDMVDTIEKLTTENTKLKELLKDYKEWLETSCYWCCEEKEKDEILAKIDELLGDKTDIKEIEE